MLHLNFSHSMINLKSRTLTSFQLSYASYIPRQSRCSDRSAKTKYRFAGWKAQPEVGGHFNRWMTATGRVEEAFSGLCARDQIDTRNLKSAKTAISVSENHLTALLSGVDKSMLAIRLLSEVEKTCTELPAWIEMYSELGENAIEWILSSLWVCKTCRVDFDLKTRRSWEVDAINEFETTTWLLLKTFENSIPKPCLEGRKGLWRVHRRKIVENDQNREIANSSSFHHVCDTFSLLIPFRHDPLSNLDSSNGPAKLHHWILKSQPAMFWHLQHITLLLASLLTSQFATLFACGTNRKRSLTWWKGRHRNAPVPGHRAKKSPLNCINHLSRQNEDIIQVVIGFGCCRFCPNDLAAMHYHFANSFAEP